MEDTKSLVTIFLQKIFHDRQYIIDNTYKIIYDYNNGDRKKIDYEKTLKSICSQLGKEIPNQVLVYLLTLVDMPLDLAESDDGQLKPVIEKIKTLEQIQKTQSCLTDTIRPHLGECVTNKTSETLQDDNSHQSDEESSSRHEEDEEQIPRSIKTKRKLTNDGSKEETLDIDLPSLLDLTADAVIKNHKKLKTCYQRKFDKAWKYIKSNLFTGDSLEKCYETLRDLNKKRKLLRDIENDNITDAVVAELYGDTDIFLKEKHVYDIVNMDIDELVAKRKLINDGSKEETLDNDLPSLLDLTTDAVIKNHKKLKTCYQRKFDKAWKYIKLNLFTGDSLEKCYETLRDLNKKRKLLRDIENDNITDAVVAELYGDTDIFLKEKHVYDIVNMDIDELVAREFNLP
ncbi:uncharacterized protein LOC115885716 [Sitophilus oryzae]|uniref:Uncharacterized protein LOC115885716 n=1 Tax=Sitophilus oryzae TaxID=7048 RepID=A0A6J2YBI7_SITOR|nr:uncharacterized protein LOC115885716 [Sitophilus oryzae]